MLFTIVASLLTVLGLGVVAVALRRYLRGPHFDETVDASGKVAIVTGANGGIGLHIVAGLATRGAKVYMACRNLEKAEEAKRTLVNKWKIPEQQLKIVPLDTASFSSVGKFADIIYKEESRLDILVCNAGVMPISTRFVKTADGHEETWQTNYLGHYLLCELLLPLLSISVDPRVVLVSSIAERLASSVEARVIGAKPSMPWALYCNSKLAQIMHARFAARHMTHVSWSAVHPGCVKTPIVRNSWLYWPMLLSGPLSTFFLKTADDGAQAILYTALSARADFREKPNNGRFFMDCHESKPWCQLAYDWSAIKQLDLESRAAVKAFLPTQRRDKGKDCD